MSLTTKKLSALIDKFITETALSPSEKTSVRALIAAIASGDSNVTLVTPVITGYTETPIALGNLGPTQVLAITAGTVLEATLTENCVFTMPSVGNGKSFTLLLKVGGTGSYSGTFTGVLWPSTGEPTVTAAVGSVDLFSFISDGTYWYGNASQGYSIPA